MKKLLSILIILFTFNSFAQDPQLYDNLWYIQNITISGNSTAPPSSTTENISISLEFDGNSFMSTICDSLFGVLIFDDSLSNFMFTELNQTLGGGCSVQENSSFEATYFSFYFSNQATPFTYSIIENINSKTLIVTAANGDQVIYGSGVLNVKEYEKTKIKLYPNPMVNEVFIKNRKQINKINIYNINGTLIKSKKIDKEDVILVNIEDFKSGIYFFTFETINDGIETIKIVKI